MAGAFRDDSVELDFRERCFVEPCKRRSKPLQLALTINDGNMSESARTRLITNGPVHYREPGVACALSTRRMQSRQSATSFERAVRQGAAPEPYLCVMTACPWYV